MIECKDFFKLLKKNNIDFYTGVPDSLLRNICAYITDNTNKEEHVISSSEGSSVGLAIGYNLSTGKIPLVYMQNSGLGNIINPILSLADSDVYKIPILLLRPKSVYSFGLLKSPPITKVFLPDFAKTMLKFSAT